MKGKVGIGLRRDISKEILESKELTPGFPGVCPGKLDGNGRQLEPDQEKGGFQAIRLPVTDSLFHLGSPEELDWDFIRELKAFLDENQVEIFSEHLSYTKSQNAHLYDLLPIPFRKDAVDHVVDRIMQVQDFLKRPLAIENVSYYTPVAAEMTEAEFIT